MDDDRYAQLESRIAALEDRLTLRRRSSSPTGWTKTPERCLLKVLIKHLVLAGFGGKALVAELKRLVPFLPELFDDPMPTDRAIIARAYWGSVPGPGGTISEWPEIHPLTKPYWDVGQAVVERGTPLTREDLVSIVENNKLPNQTPLLLEAPRSE